MKRLCTTKYMQWSLIPEFYKLILLLDSYWFESESNNQIDLNRNQIDSWACESKFYWFGKSVTIPNSIKCYFSVCSKSKNQSGLGRGKHIYIYRFLAFWRKYKHFSSVVLHLLDVYNTRMCPVPILCLLCCRNSHSTFMMSWTHIQRFISIWKRLYTQHAAVFQHVLRAGACAAVCVGVSGGLAGRSGEA